jgi:hypothetical protein
MNPFEMVAIIVIAALIAGVLRSRYKTAAPTSTLAELQSLAHAQQQRIAQLEARIQALEAVVGDTQYELRRQFKDL